MKKLVSLLLALVMVLGLMPYRAIAKGHDGHFLNAPADETSSKEYCENNQIGILDSDNWKAWAQGDSRWGSIPMGTSGRTIAQDGCLVTSVTKLIIQAGLRDSSTFNVATLANWLNSNNGYVSGTGRLYYGKPAAFISGLSNHGYLRNPDDGITYYSSTENDTIISWIRAGYHMSINVNGGGHWVAVDEGKSLSTGQVYIMDSLSNVDTNYNLRLVDRYSTFIGIHAYTGGSIGSSDNTPPTITNVEITELSSSGFMVSCNVSDDVGVSSVRFPTWTANNDQDDLIWHTGTIVGDTASCYINVSDHNNEKDCYYCVHIYAFDAADNATCFATGVYVPAIDPVNFHLSNVDMTSAVPVSEGGDGFTDEGYLYLGVSPYSKMYSLHFLVDYPEEFVSIVDYSKTFAGGLIDLITASIANNTQTSDSFNASCDITYVGQTGGSPVGEPGNMYANGGCWNTSWSFGGVQVGGNFIRLSIRLDKAPLVSDCEQDSNGYYLPVPLTLLEFTQSEMKEGGYYGASVNYCLPENNADWLTATAGKIYVTPVDHYHSLQFVPAANPTCTQNGHIGYYFCEGCGKCYSDADGENEITLASTVIPVLGHEYHEEDDVYYPATCVRYEHIQHTCWRCGFEYNEYLGEKTDWSTDYPEGIDEVLIETGTEYRYRDHEETSSSESNLEGWNLYATVTEYGDYGPWSEWQFEAVSNTDLCMVQTRTAYPYYYFYCPSCGTNARYPYWGSNYYCDFCGTAIPSDTGTVEWYPNPWSDSTPWGSNTGKYYQYINGCLVWNWSDGAPTTQYRYCVREEINTYFYDRWTDWSEWSPEPVEATDTREVETRTVYRYVIGEYGQHEWDEGVVTIEPTIYTEGEMTYTCVHCHETYTEAIPVLVSFTVTFMDWDGSIIDIQQVEAGTAATAPADPSREGYTFTGWDVDFSCVTSDLIVTAQYEQNVQPTDPPIPSDAPKIVVESKTAVAGNTVAVAVKLENNPGIISMKLRLSYDGRLTLTSVEDTGLLPGKMHAPSLTNPYLLVWENDTASSNYTVNGTIAILTFEIPEGTDAGDYSVNISYDADNYDIFNFDLDSVDFAVVNGKITVLDVLIGDVNSDGRVNAMDRALLGRYLAGWASVPASMINMTAADVNLDGSVNTRDRAILGRHLAGWAGYEELPYTAKSAEIVPAPAKAEGDAPTITVSSVTAQPGETVTVDLSLDNNPGVISMMLRLAYDPALTLISVEDTGVMPGREHDLTNFINPYILYWANETASSNITANGVIARLTFRLADDAAPGVYPITVSYDNGNYDIFDYDFVPVDFEVVNGGVTSVLLGDINGDGELTFADVSALSGFALGLMDAELTLDVADINGDGEIGFTDVSALSARILG